MHCDKRPQCYTDYKPQYTQNFNLTSLIVGNHSWTYDPAEYSDWSIKFGYLDAKPMYTAEGESQGEIHVKITVGKTNHVLLCGTVKDSLKHTLFYLDANVKPEALANYKPSSNRVEWGHKKYLGGECKFLNSLPTGTHVVSIRPHQTPNHKHVTGLTHVIMWP